MIVSEPWRSADELLALLSDRPFITFSELVSWGIFGTLQSAHRAVRQGYLTCMKISPRRSIVPRQNLLEYLKTRLVNAPLARR